MHIAEVLLHPPERSLINISDVLVIAAGAETIVQNDEVSLATVERIGDGTEIAFKRLHRAFKGAARWHFHVVVAYCAENGHVEWGYGADVVGVERLHVAHNVAQIDGENVHRFAPWSH